MNILSNLLVSVLPVIRDIAKDTIETKFEENVARKAITTIANTAIDTICDCGLEAVKQSDQSTARSISFNPENNVSSFRTNLKNESFRLTL